MLIACENPGSVTVLITGIEILNHKLSTTANREDFSYRETKNISNRCNIVIQWCLIAQDRCKTIYQRAYILNDRLKVKSKKNY